MIIHTNIDTDNCVKGEGYIEVEVHKSENDTCFVIRFNGDDNCAFVLDEKAFDDLVTKINWCNENR